MATGLSPSSSSACMLVLNCVLLFPGSVCNRYARRRFTSPRLTLLMSTACIDTAISYISSTITEGTDPLSDQICDTMLATIFTFIAPQCLLPAQQRLDDCKRVMDRRVFYDEPNMQALISSLGEPSRLFLGAAADRERSRLPLFPAQFVDWDSKGNRLGTFCTVYSSFW